jgi:hypothetical protein
MFDYEFDKKCKNSDQTVEIVYFYLNIVIKMKGN